MAKLVQKPFVGTRKCDVVVEGTTYEYFIVKKGSDGNVAVIKCGLPRSRKNIKIFPQERILNERPASLTAAEEWEVEDGKVFNKTAIYRGEKVFVVRVGADNLRICELETFKNRKSFLVSIDDLCDDDGNLTIENHASTTAEALNTIPDSWR